MCATAVLPPAFDTTITEMNIDKTLERKDKRCALVIISLLSTASIIKRVGQNVNTNNTKLQEAFFK